MSEILEDKKQDLKDEATKPSKDGIFKKLKGFFVEEVNESEENLKNASPTPIIQKDEAVENILEQSKSKKQPLKEDTPVIKSKKNENPLEKRQNIAFGTGINLVLTQTKEEIVVEEKKTKLNLSSVFVLVIFAIITILTFGANIAYKLTYNIQVKKVNELKETFEQDYYLITANNKILDRLVFIQGLSESHYSPKQVLTFLKDLVNIYGEVTNFTLTNDLEFTLVGSTGSYEEASRLWHLMVVNEEIETVIISSISKASEDKVFITFEGKLKYKSFAKLLENSNE